MKLKAPKQITFWVAVVVALIGVIVSFVAIPFLSNHQHWIIALGFVILAAGNLVEAL